MSYEVEISQHVYQEGLHPQVVSLALSELSTFIFPEEDFQDHIILALQPQRGGRRQQASIKSILVHARTDTGAGVILQDEREMIPSKVLHVSPILAVLNGLSSHDKIQIKRIRENSVILSSVTLMPLDTNFDINRNNTTDFKKNLLQYSHVVQQGGLVLLPKDRRGTFRDTSEVLAFYVLECSPLLQGIITENDTLLCLVDDVQRRQETLWVKTLYDEMFLGNKSVNRGLTASMDLSNSFHTQPMKPLIVSSFMAKTSQPTPLFPPQARSSASPPSTTVHLSIALLEKPISPIEPVPPYRMKFVEVGVTFKTLRALELFSSSWVMITPPDSSREHIGRLYLVDPPLGQGNCHLRTQDNLSSSTNLSSSSTSLSSSNLFSSNLSSSTTGGGVPSYLPYTLYVSPVMMFNLGLEPGTTAAVTLRLLENFHENIHPTEAYLASVHMPSLTPSITASLHLDFQKYFSQPRLFKQGDVFGIKLKSPLYCYGHCNTLDEAEDEDLIKNHIAYFKVCSMKDGYVTNSGVFGFIQKGHTDLYHEGFINTRVPPNLERFFGFPGQFPEVYPPGFYNVFQSVGAMISPCLHPLSSSLGLEASILLHGPAGTGKYSLVKCLADNFGISVSLVNCYDLLGQAEGETEKNLKASFETAKRTAPSILYLRRIEAIEKSGTVQDHEDPPIANLLRECIHHLVGCDPPVVVVATTHSVQDLAPTIRTCFREEVKLEAPDLESREKIIDYLASEHSVNRDVNLRDLAVHTASYTPRDLRTLFEVAARNALGRAMRNKWDLMVEEEVCSAGVAIAMADYDAAMNHLQLYHSSSLGAPKIPNVKWEDVGGLANAKKEILDTIELPLQHPELFGKGLKQRSGVLLYGPPGTGKTLLAKAVATECALNFISVKGPELINMYVGESEKNVRNLFQKARDAKPCVIFFDELDSLAPNRGRSGDSGGVMDRVVSQLLAELSDINTAKDIFVIGATNRPDLIDPALLVPGRFDKLLYLGVAEDVESRVKVLQALTRKFNLLPGTSVENIATHCPTNLTGADFYALAADAYSIATHQLISDISRLGEEEIQKYHRGLKKAIVQVGESHFVEALKRLAPSVSVEELMRYKNIQNKFYGKKN